jgi:hypothetical protein
MLLLLLLLLWRLLPVGQLRNRTTQQMLHIRRCQRVLQEKVAAAQAKASLPLK